MLGTKDPVIGSVVKIDKHSHIVDYDPKPLATVGSFNWMLESKVRGEKDLVIINKKITEMESQLMQLKNTKDKIEAVLSALA